jgi:hypothetical protein
MELSKVTPMYKLRFYEEAACKDVSTPAFFDQTNPNDIYAKAALEICSTCTVQLECVIVVNPRESLFDGVCGGKVWSNGKIVGDKNGRAIDTWNDIDEVAVDLLIAGQIHWKKLSVKERKYAAIKMRQNGVSISVIMDKCRISGNHLKTLFQKEGIN